MALGPRGDVLLGTDLGIAATVIDGDSWTDASGYSAHRPGRCSSIAKARSGSAPPGSPSCAAVAWSSATTHRGCLAGDDVWASQAQSAGKLWAGTNRLSGPR